MSRFKSNLQIKFLAVFSLISLCFFIFGQGCGIGFKATTISSFSSEAYPLDHPEMNPTAKLTETSLLLMDRVQIESFLKSIFGESTNVILNETIKQDYEGFGLACDPYAPTGINDCKNIKMTVFPYETEFATAISFANQSASGRLSSVREGYRLNACDQIIQKDEHLNFALNQISLSLTSVPTESSATGIVNLFFPFSSDNELIGKKIFEELTQSNIKNFSTSQKWRFIFLAVCYSPDWQVL